MSNFDYDDYGEWNGLKIDDFSGAARSLIERFISKAYGRRPMDWAKRDLIYGSARRDRRNFQLQKLIKNKPAFLFPGTRHLPRNQATAVANYRSFMFIYYLRVLRIHASLQSQKLWEKTGRLLSCPPNLFQVSGGENFQNCDQARLCPFCLARAAESVYRTDNDKT